MTGRSSAPQFGFKGAARGAIQPSHPSRPECALSILRGGGLKLEAIQVIVGAAGGPKWTASFSAAGSPAAEGRSTWWVPHRGLGASRRRPKPTLWPPSTGWGGLRSPSATTPTPPAVSREAGRILAHYLNLPDAGSGNGPQHSSIKKRIRPSEMSETQITGFLSVFYKITCAMAKLVVFQENTWNPWHISSRPQPKEITNFGF